MPALPTMYDLKRIAVYPRLVRGRRREQHQPDFVARALELASYRRSAYEFLDATVANPDILFDADLGPHSVVLDVGAFDGEWALGINDRYGATVLSFELSPAIVPFLESATRDHPGVRPLPYGLGARNAALPVSRRGMGSSVFAKGSHDEWDEGLMRDVSEVWAELDLGDVDLMKINIEGGEYDLLERMVRTGLTSRVRCFLIQFHEHVPAAYRRRRRIRRALATSHGVVWDYPFAWEKWTRKAAE